MPELPHLSGLEIVKTFQGIGIIFKSCKAIAPRLSSFPQRFSMPLHWK
jgi:hypothetical protein